ncbi:fibronectin type III domain-containing protein [Dokdonia sp. Hel_I_53]|uniref:fibronectin type III domain-containing protein n=1 Tax=Dokdonia sp. Hel_I_53 TaxID=1566287 RepID=UPI00119B9B98|nr:hypothetical protein [Dokdonia sp. Hel_I_53]TVZ53368.1 hypothetical protein OD90_2574 [Dokdonia sp. Hel_I_53]
MKNTIIIFSLLLTLTSQGQSVTDTLLKRENRIEVLARVTENEALIRWAPTKPISWKQLNRYGYILERYTIIRDGKTLAQPEARTLSSAPIVPQPLAAWESIVQINDNAAIVAQAIYGETFDVTGTDKIESIVALSEDIEQRHTFALYTADQDFKVAEMAGLGYKDNTAAPNEKYVYRVISAVPEQINDIQYGGVFQGYQDYEPLPKPIDLVSTFTDAATSLSWNFKIHKDIFTSYNIERAQEGEAFKKINKRPYTLLNQAADERTGRIYYMDSIANNKGYKYRVQGISVFGETSPYSDEAGGTGRAALGFTPFLTTKEFLDINTVKLTWEFPEEANGELSSFSLNRSNGLGETQEVLIKDIPPTARSIKYNKLLPSNYFTVSAIGKYGSQKKSFPMLVQPVDSIPPSRPIGLTGKIDSSGVVHIKWKANTDVDIFGYRVFRGNLENEEYSQITSKPISTTAFRDSVSIKNLNSKVYYKIVAIDYRYNQSDYSEPLVLKKPDIIPPTSPVFKTFKVDEQKINLSWAKSSSRDAVTTQLYRKENDSKDWLLVYEGENDIEQYVDNDGTEGTLYSYTLIAIDESKLESLPSPSVSIKIPKNNKDNQVRNFYGAVNKQDKSIQLSWSYRSDDIVEFELYKSITGEKMRLLRIVPADIRRLIDPTLKINTSYTYGIRAVFKDGRISKLKKMTIKY